MLCNKTLKWGGGRKKKKNVIFTGMTNQPCLFNSHKDECSSFKVIRKKWNTLVMDMQTTFHHFMLKKNKEKNWAEHQKRFNNVNDLSGFGWMKQAFFLVKKKEERT